MFVHVHFSALEEYRPVYQDHVERRERKVMPETVVDQSQVEAAHLLSIE